MWSRQCQGVEGEGHKPPVVKPASPRDNQMQGVARRGKRNLNQGHSELGRPKTAKDPLRLNTTEWKGKAGVSDVLSSWWNTVTKATREKLIFAYSSRESPKWQESPGGDHRAESWETMYSTTHRKQRGWTGNGEAPNCQGPASAAYFLQQCSSSQSFRNFPAKHQPRTKRSSMYGARFSFKPSQLESSQKQSRMGGKWW